MSTITKTLIDLQTFDGCFTLTPALAAVLGVDLAILEAKISSSGPLKFTLGSNEQHRSIWATMLAVRMFEMKLKGDCAVWQLVVDKARAWIRINLNAIGWVETELEKIADEVLGV